MAFSTHKFNDDGKRNPSTSFLPNGATAMNSYYHYQTIPQPPYQQNQGIQNQILVQQQQYFQQQQQQVQGYGCTGNLNDQNQVLNIASRKRPQSFNNTVNVYNAVMPDAVIQNPPIQPHLSFPDSHRYEIISLAGMKPSQKNDSNLLHQYYQLPSNEAAILECMNFIILKPYNPTNGAHTSFGQRLSEAYCLSHGRPRKMLHAVVCKYCFSAGCRYARNSVRFVPTPEALLSAVYEVFPHLLSCPYINKQLKNRIMGTERNSRFSSAITMRNFIPLLCSSYRVFLSNRTPPKKFTRDDVYSDNMETLDEAKMFTTMNLEGVLATNICDLVNIDPINDPPFVLFILELLELVRLSKAHNPYEYTQLSEGGMNGEAPDIFLLRCNIRHRKSEDGSSQTHDPNSSILLKGSKQCAVDITRFVYSHLDNYLKGRKLAVYKMLKPDPQEDRESFKQFAHSLHERCVDLISWLEELPKPKIDPRQDTEIWMSLSKEHIRELWDRVGYVPLSNLMCPTSPKGNGCAVLECNGFPKYGLLHGTLDTSTLSEMKTPRWRSKHSRTRKEYSPSGKVEHCDILSWRAFLPQASRPLLNLKSLKANDNLSAGAVKPRNSKTLKISAKKNIVKNIETAITIDDRKKNSTNAKSISTKIREISNCDKFGGIDELHFESMSMIKARKSASTFNDEDHCLTNQVREDRTLEVDALPPVTGQKTFTKQSSNESEESTLKGGDMVVQEQEI